ncbi:hypothetical protein PR002_g3675 [Phytophthora rubi]|uniref:Uncharacterized protein n=1 Tax=Phytophthora rubi TaxID=129364 RepID=A0A6A3NBP2_9STRA|nr:hypothetical protein PR002_g3675 [Phytophthora rubi]
MGVYCAIWGYNSDPFVTPVATAEEMVVADSSLVVEDEVDEGVETEVTVVDRKRLTSDNRGSVAAAIDGIAVTALMLDTGANTSLVARGVLEALVQTGTVLRVNSVAGITLSSAGKEAINVTSIVTFDEVVLIT